MSAEPYDVFSYALPANAAIGRYLRVKLLSTGKVALAAGAETSLGVTTNITSAADEDVAINSKGSPSGRYLTDVAITAGDKVYGADAGKVDKANALTDDEIGIALTTTGGSAGEIVDVAHVPLN